MTDKDKERQEVSLIGRILSMEALIIVMGTLSLIYGLIRQEHMNIFFGVVIICGFFILRKVRKKDWAKHWEEMEAEQKARAAYAQAKKQRQTADSTPSDQPPP